MEALTLAVIGLAFFVGAAILAPTLGWESPAIIWRVGLILAAVAAYFLVALLAWVYRKGQQVTGEAIIGFITLLVAMLSLMGGIANEEGEIKVFWLVMAIVLIPAAMALVMLAAIAKREGKAGR